MRRVGLCRVKRVIAWCKSSPMAPGWVRLCAWFKGTAFVVLCGRLLWCDSGLVSDSVKLLAASDVATCLPMGLLPFWEKHMRFPPVPDGTPMVGALPLFALSPTKEVDHERPFLHAKQFSVSPVCFCYRPWQAAGELKGGVPTQVDR